MSSTLLDFLLDLLSNPGSQDEFETDPEGYLAEHGLSGVCEADIADALPIVIDYAPAHVAASFDREYSTGGNSSSAGGHTGGVEHVAGSDGDSGGSEHAAVITQLHHVVNNYSFVDDRDTILDNSVNQNLVAYGDVSQVFDNDPVLASGDGAVAAGGHVEDVVTGDLHADNGSAVVVGDDNETAIDNSEHTDNSINDSFNDDSDNSVTDNSVNDSYNTDESVDNSVHVDDSFNTDASDNSVNTVVEDSFNVHDESVTTDVAIEDSFNDESVSTVVEDSFNDESVDTDIAIEDSFTSDDDVKIVDSFEDHSVTKSDDDVVDVH